MVPCSRTSGGACGLREGDIAHGAGVLDSTTYLGVSLWWVCTGLAVNYAVYPRPYLSASPACRVYTPACHSGAPGAAGLCGLMVGALARSAGLADTPPAARRLGDVGAFWGTGATRSRLAA